MCSHMDGQGPTGTLQASNDEVGNIGLQLQGAKSWPDGHLHVVLSSIRDDDLAEMFSASDVGKRGNNVVESKSSHRGDGLEMAPVNQDEELIEKTWDGSQSFSLVRLQGEKEEWRTLQQAGP